MNTAPGIGIQGLHTLLRVLFILLVAVFSLFFASVLDPLAAVGLGGIVFALLGWFFIRRVTWPLKEVAEAARQITRCEHAARLPVPARGGDIAVLATAINGLLAARERQTRELLTSETQFLGTFENAAVGIAHVGLDCHWLRVNSRLCEITGYPREELFTKTFIDITHPDDLETDMANVRSMLAGEIPSYSLEKRYIRKDGSVTWVLLTVSLARDATGEPAYFISVVEDISARKQTEEALRESEERLSTVVEHLTEGLIIADSHGTLIHWNPAALAMHGYASMDECRHEIATFVDIFELRTMEGDRVLTLEEWPMPRILRGEVLKACEMRVRRPDQGWERILSYSGSQVRSASGETLSVLSAVDITDRKRAEEEISAAKETAEAASRAKDDFLASLSHELRTPLNPVLMLASEMEQRDALAPALREDFALIHKYVALEARLIDDLLDVTRITRGKLQLDLQRVNAHAVLNQALAVVHADVVQKKIALSLELNATNSWVKADPVRLQQVFWNVLCNAVKFTPHGGRITVRSHNSPEQRICVEITDTGIGMRPEELARMFTAFSQGEHAIQPGSQYRFGGLGLGLTICRQLVTMHGGQIHARSDGRGKGSVFTIELPLAPAEAVSSEEVPAGVSPQAAASTPKHLHILLVEDHEPTRTTLSRLLRRRGHDVMCADSLAAGRKLVTNLATPQGEAGFDLLISDLGLPDGNGCELMAELRNRYKATIKGVALSGFGMEDDIQRSLASGFSTHLTKPVDIQSLENAIQMEQ